MLPKVSIIMPSLNVGPYIKECIESVIHQTETEIEIICIDAGSTDGTLETLESYASADERIVLLHSVVKSYGAQVNQGISNAKGKYIAILETDDYVDAHMYESLYEIAEKYNVDYVKADYEKFYTLKNGQRIIEKVKLWNEEAQMYNKVISPKQCEYLYTHDFSVWKGIYRRDFLIENKIWLNESPGAAFQDIGFMELVLANAKTAYYSDYSFYRYRLDRDEASSYSEKCLKFSYQEFRRLVEENLGKEEPNWHGLYKHMVVSFMSEYAKALYAQCYLLDEEYSAYATWFRNKLSDAIETKMLCLNDLDDGIRDHAKQVLYEPEKYIRILREKKQDDYISHIVKEIVSQKEKRPIIIYGAGGYGINLLKKLDKLSIEVLAFTDNNECLKGSFIGGIEVVSVPEVFEQHKEAYFAISSKTYLEQMKERYFLFGGKEEYLI